MQFFGESGLYVFLSVIIALILVKIGLPYLNKFLGKEIPLTFLLDMKVLSGLIISVIFVSFLSGIFPAFIATKFNPVQILKNSIIFSKNKNINLRNSFVVSQFVISIALVIITFSVRKQLDYLQNKELGYQKKGILNTILHDDNMRDKYQTLKNELVKNSNILDVTVSNMLPNDINNQTFANWEGKTDEDSEIYWAVVAENFPEFYNMRLKEGSGFSKTNNANSSFIFNETAIKNFDLNIHTDEFMRINQYNGQINGVIEDIHYNPLHLKIKPMALIKMNGDDIVDFGWYLSVKMNLTDMQNTISYVEKVYKQFSLNYPFHYSFLDSSIEKAYLDETRFKTLVQFFSIIAICIACLGLFGLAKYSLEKRIKEIGVRKVNGANIMELIVSLNSDIVKWIVIAFAIAAPFSYYLINLWLGSFAYKTKISWWFFAFSGLLVVTVAILTISWQSWRAARRNPVEALRYE